MNWYHYMMMFYYFSFTRFAGFDRVFFSEQCFWNAGDLLQTSDDFLLCLGEEVSFPELYIQRYPEVKMKVVYPWFFDQHFLSFLHRMVYEWYSTYKNVMKYFVSLEIQEVLMREGKVRGEREKVKGEREKVKGERGQTLIIFPDNWTRVNMLGEVGGTHLYSTDTQNRKDINWWMIKKGIAQTIVATQSEVFQPFSALKKIIFVDPQKWYYNNQQDPRYSLPTVVQKMAEIYGAEVEEIKKEGKLAFER